jgi:4-amino-4-deoxy-L-arabinose transferase-like glycosyltransferase
VFVWTQDIWAARLVGVLYMLSTYSIFLTSFVSNPNFLPTFIVWALYHLTIIVDKRGQLFNFIVLGILVGLASQLHTTALVVLLPLVALTLIFIRTKIEIRNILSLLLAFVASNFLYLYFESSIKFQNLKRLLDLASSNLHGNQALSNLSAIINFFFGSLSPFSKYYSFTNFQFGWMYFIVGMLGLFALLIILNNIFQGKITNKLTFKISRSGVYILTIWVSLVLLMVLSYNRVVPNHYFVILWPFPIIILGFVVIWISNKFNLKYSLLVFVLLTYIFQIVTYYNSPKESWNNFFQKYDLYKNLPNISEIGNKGYEPYLTPPGEVK